ncbi:hypothetical protein CEN47_16050 [Fischerella thermalis CCMEE 5319]|nr:hypothetical protein CEN47_16050 [Fischerella thermalis CCMEE 5319]
MLPTAVEEILYYCKQRIARFQKFRDTGLIEIRCCPYRGQYKVECRCGELEYFPITPEDLAVWNPSPLPKQWEKLETLEHVLVTLNSALFETFCQWQGYATIIIFYRAYDDRYGFQFIPSMIYGIKPC